MHTEKYLRITANSGKCSDEHYACMQRWVRKPDDPGIKEKCRSAAESCLKAIAAELRYLENLQTAPNVTSRIDIVRELQALVKRDLTLLTDH